MEKHAFSTLALCVLVLLLAAAQAEGGEYSRVDKEHLVEPITASYLGGSGTEWLTGGGFQPDGTLVLGGVALGPTFELGNIRVIVPGTDQSPPASQEWPIQIDGKGKPKLDKEGNPKRDTFSHSNPAATAFVVRISPDFKRVITAFRLPWKAGTMTDCVVDAKGGIYIAGYGNVELLKSLCNDAVELSPPTIEISKQSPDTRTNYIAKVSFDGSKVEWVRLVTAPQDYPRLRVLRSGHILFKGLSFDTFDEGGRRIDRLSSDRGFNARHYDLDEASREIAYGHEHHWPTGREPWRCPELKIFNADGSVKYHLYDWPGPLMGITRLVSDSVIKTVEYMPDGNLLFTAWSDGGNSVMYSQPYSFDERAWNGREAGLRLSAAGAGAMSFSYILKMDTKTCKIQYGTLWTSLYKGVESTRITATHCTRDGSVAIAGSVWGHLYATPNAFKELSADLWKPGNQSNLTILNPSLDGLRFSSVMTGCGEIDLGNRANFMWFSGVVKGRELLVAVSAAVDHDLTPRLNALQNKFGGGHLDGHFVVFDLSP